jgi:hypothetical protein
MISPTSWLLTLGGSLVLLCAAGLRAEDAPPVPSNMPPATEAEAEPHEGAPSGLEPSCRAELKRLCQGVQPGGGRIRQCIEQNQQKLSPQCRAEFQQKAARMKEKVQQLHAACEADVKRFCPNVQAGGGRIKACLEDHYKELSETCYSALERPPQGKR